MVKKQRMRMARKHWRALDAERTAAPETEFEELLRRFNEIEYDLVVRKIRVCLIRGDKSQALDVFTRYLAVKPVTLFETSVIHLGLPEKLADRLEQAGFATLGSLLKAKRSDLLAVEGVGQAHIDVINSMLSDQVGRRVTMA